LGNLLRAAFAVHSSADLALDEEDLDRATELYVESLELCRRLGLEAGLAYGLAGLAAAASGKGAAKRGAVLWGAVEAIEQNIGKRLFDDERARYQRWLTNSCERHPDAIEEGRKLSLEEAVARALTEL
jgi:hypothetical protein